MPSLLIPIVLFGDSIDALIENTATLAEMIFVPLDTDERKKVLYK